ncbi:MAG: hypothetical protein IPG45_34900 [Deltaproteobacteria bacterium]|nr:hypothetical protein [Deltaproteobacteria bacterium]
MASGLRQLWVGVGLLLYGCGGDVLLDAPEPRPSPDGGVIRRPENLTRLREDFDNLHLVESTEPGEVVDVNRGIASLPTYTFPIIEGFGISNYDENLVVNDLLEAQVIHVAPGATLEVPDSVELRAALTITVQGTIRAGAGGVILAAQEGIFIEPGALIESDGPVTLLLGSPEGEIRIDGDISTWARTNNKERPNLEVIGRGQLTVGGQLLTFAEPGQQSGDVRLNFYGDVVVTGRAARIAATAQAGAIPGVVRIFSEANLKIAEGSIGTGFNYDSIDGSQGGALELRANTIELNSGGNVVAGRTIEAGGDLQLTAQERIEVGDGCLVQAGGGAKGGSTVVRTKDLVLKGSSRVAGGTGERQGGGLGVEAASRIFVDGPGTLAAGDAACGDGGHASFVTGGLFHATGGAVVRGGDADISGRCSRGSPGGDVILQAASIVGLETGARGGAGQPAGRVIRNETTVALTNPDLSLGSSGRILSKVVDRGEAAVGKRPLLLDFGGETPLGTSITVRLCGVANLDDPFLDWRDVTEPEGEPLEAFRQARYFRYRVELHGRAFDTPVLDYFEIDLDPAE